MPRKSQPKLLRVVCRRAALIRARFGDPPSLNKIKQSVENAPFIDRTGERFRSKLAKLSIGTSWSSIRKVNIVDESIPHHRISSK